MLGVLEQHQESEEQGGKGENGGGRRQEDLRDKSGAQSGVGLQYLLVRSRRLSFVVPGYLVLEYSALFTI